MRKNTLNEQQQQLQLFSVWPELYIASDWCQLQYQGKLKSFFMEGTDRFVAISNF